MRVLVAIALVTAGGCVSVFTDSGAGWTPSDGAPTCGPGTGVAVDAGLVAAGIFAALALPATCGNGDEFGDGMCRAMVAAPGMLVAIGGAGGMIVGGVKMSTCSATRRRWGTTRASVVATIARETGTEAMELGDTLVLTAPTAAVCASNDWFVRVHAHRVVLASKGLVRASCRTGDIELAGGRLDL